MIPIRLECVSQAAVQGVANLQLADGRTSPLTNISLVVGETCERKSATDACFFKEHFAFGGGWAGGSERDLEYSLRLKVWNIKKTALEKQLAAAQEVDGYIYTTRTIDPVPPPARRGRSRSPRAGRWRRRVCQRVSRSDEG